MWFISTSLWTRPSLQERFISSFNASWQLRWTLHIPCLLFWGDAKKAHEWTQHRGQHTANRHTCLFTHVLSCRQQLREVVECKHSKSEERCTQCFCVFDSTNQNMLHWRKPLALHHMYQNNIIFYTFCLCGQTSLHTAVETQHDLTLWSVFSCLANSFGFTAHNFTVLSLSLSLVSYLYIYIYS